MQNSTLCTLRQKWTSCCSHNGIYQLPHHSWWVVLVAFACTRRYATWQQGWVLWQAIRCWRWWPAPIERRIMSSNPRVNQGTCAHPPIHVSSMFTPGSQATGRHHSNLHRNDIYEMVGGLYPFVSNHPVVCSSFLCAVLIRWWSWTPSVAVRTTTCMLRFIFGGAAFFLGNNPSQLAPGPSGCYSLMQRVLSWTKDTEAKKKKTSNFSSRSSIVWSWAMVGLVKCLLFLFETCWCWVTSGSYLGLLRCCYIVGHAWPIKHYITNRLLGFIFETSACTLDHHW